MKSIKVLGTGCQKCKALMEMVKEVALEKGFDGTIEKVEDISEIVSYGVMSTPAVMVDGVVIFSGSLPTKSQVKSWF